MEFERPNIDDAMRIELKKLDIINDMKTRGRIVINEECRKRGYDNHLDVEATASSPVAPTEWKDEARAIAEWFYDIFQQLEAKEAEINAMTTDEELNAFNIQEWIESLPAIPQ